MARQQRWEGVAQRQSRLIISHKILKANESGERLYLLKVCSNDTLIPSRPCPFRALQPPQTVPTGQHLPAPEPVRGSFHSNFLRNFKKGDKQNGSVGKVLVPCQITLVQPIKPIS